MRVDDRHVSVIKGRAYFSYRRRGAVLPTARREFVVIDERKFDAVHILACHALFKRVAEVAHICRAQVLKSRACAVPPEIEYVIVAEIPQADVVAREKLSRVGRKGECEI